MKMLIVLALLFGIMLTGGCGIDQTVYDNALSEIARQDQIINELNYQLASIKPVGYFNNRLEIERWLDTVPKLGVSKDTEEWYQYAFYYQQKALENGYIISVSYTIDDNNLALTCDIVTQDGWLYYFDPDDCDLQDTGIRVDMVDPEELEKNYGAIKL